MKNNSLEIYVFNYNVVIMVYSQKNRNLRELGINLLYFFIICDNYFLLLYNNLVI